ncbi:MAG: hypothetical protein JWO35_879 [Candidatus Saccharibacteria bacterium]|nr:hypothetical protein [Candidatus Saccharibacteria bacterium]
MEGDTTSDKYQKIVEGTELDVDVDVEISSAILCAPLVWCTVDSFRNPEMDKADSKARRDNLVQVMAERLGTSEEHADRAITLYETLSKPRENNE